jgi:[ribosomal protein S5]-alanine N-acetyltransferase
MNLRPYRADDAAALFAIQRDPVAMRFTHVATSLESSAARFAAWESMRKRHGFAPWVVRDARNEKVIGWGGVGIDPDDPVWGAEVVYFFHPSLWAKGFATELTRTAMAAAFDEWRLARLAAFTHPDNSPSARVLQKCGFVCQGWEPRLQRDHYIANNPNVSQ